jgi:hypothetical protein
MTSLKARLVELRFFAGLPLAQAADYLGIYLSSADRAWWYSRVRLYAAMASKDSGKNNICLTYLGCWRRMEG